MAGTVSSYLHEVAEEDDANDEREEGEEEAFCPKEQPADLVHGREEKYSANDFVQWTSYNKKIPILVFRAEALHKRIPELRQLAEKYHMSYKLYMHECKLVRNILASHGFREAHPNSNDFNLMWTGSHVKPFVLRSMLEHQKINHFPRSYELTRKDRLYKNVQRMQQLKGFKHFDFVPTTFVLPAEFGDFNNAFMREKGTWIVKPVASSRGRGIFLVNHPDQAPTDETHVVCRYVQKPFLIDGFKFDLRLYVAVTSFDPLLIYLFEEGLARFATVRFDKSQRSIQNQCMHLTNYSVNKKNEDFVRNEDPEVEDYGNKWSLGALLRCLREEGHDATAVMMRIEDVIVKTIIASEAPIATACKMFMPHRGNCFEIFGFDVLLDSNLRPWVLEVNLSPSLNCDSPLDLKIKSHMVSDLLSLTGFALHDPCTRLGTQPNRRTAGNGTQPRAETAAVIRDSGGQQRLQRPLSATRWPRASSKHPRDDSRALSVEEVKIVRRVKEEHARRGGWVRIFPTRDTWDLYGEFLQFTTTSNVLLHERLFGESVSDSYHGKRFGGSSSTINKLRTLRIYDTPAHAFLSGNNQQQYERLYVSALQRSCLYERKLGAEPIPVGSLRSLASCVAIKTVPEVGAISLGSAAPVQQPQDKRPTTLPPPQAGQSAAVLAQGIAKPAIEREPNLSKPHAALDSVATVAPVDTLQSRASAEAPLPVVPLQRPRCDSWSAVRELEAGASMSKVQARRAFATYLIRVQHRLLADGSSGAAVGDDGTADGTTADDASDEQTELVLRFLRRASVNLSQPFKVVVPGRRLPLSVRRRILAKQLGDFVHLYSKETDLLKYDALILSNGDSASDTQAYGGLDDEKFESFIAFAEESELEALLTAYTKINKSASTFLGRSGASVNRSPNAVGSLANEHSFKEESCRKNGNAAEYAKTSSPSRPTRASSAGPAGMREIGRGGGEALTKPGERETAASERGAWQAEMNGLPVGASTLYKPQSVADYSVHGSQSRPSALTQQSPSAPFTSSYASAVHIYSTGLQRPASASDSGSRPRPVSGVHAARLSRPSSARHSNSGTMATDSSHGNRADADELNTRPPHHPISAFEESGGDVNTAFHNLHLRQRERNYRTLNVPNGDQSGTTVTGGLPSSNAVTTKSAVAAETSTRSPGERLYPPANLLADETGSDRKLVDQLVDAMTTDGNLLAAYSAVTGVKPMTAFVPSRHSSQYEILKADTADKQQQMISSSRALLEASKAMHQEMVAQAHAATKRLHDVASASGDGIESALAPRPPTGPKTSGPASVARRVSASSRKYASSDVDAGQDAFYDTLKYNPLTGMSRPFK